MLFNYRITTTISRARGSLEAKDEAEAKAILFRQYSHDPANGELPDGNPVLVDITLEEVE